MEWFVSNVIKMHSIRKLNSEKCALVWIIWIEQQAASIWLNMIHASMFFFFFFWVSQFCDVCDTQGKRNTIRTFEWMCYFVLGKTSFRFQYYKFTGHVNGFVWLQTADWYDTSSMSTIIVPIIKGKKFN